MTNEQILRKAIEKAITNGYKDEYSIIYHLDENESFIEDGILDNGEWYSDHWEISVYHIIFSHEFAKAFFGEEDETYEILDMDFTNSKPKWKIYLEKMVLKKEPLKYLERFVCEHVFEEGGEPHDFCLKCNIKRYMV